jgi:hypothetical protein
LKWYHYQNSHSSINPLVSLFITVSFGIYSDHLIYTQLLDAGLNGICLIRNIMKNDRKKNMTMAPGSLFRRRALTPKKSKKDLIGLFWGLSAIPPLVDPTVVSSAI